MPIGGVNVGDAGTGIYTGYTLSWGDDFDALDLVAPHTPTGRWFTTRTYLPGARGSDTLLSTMYDTDPYHTGHEDSNRGVPLAYNNMSVASSILSLQARDATAGEKLGMSSPRNEVAAMISGPGAVHWYPGAAATQDIIYEARLRYSAAAGAPNGWHPTMWLNSLNPVQVIESDEIDWEGNSDNAYFYRNVWNAGVNTGTGPTGTPFAHDGAFHNITIFLNTTSVAIYIDGALYSTGAFSANTKSKPQYPLFTSHVYNGTFEGDTYSEAAWNADGNGATFDIDWVRVWRRTGKGHFTPLTTIANVNVAYGASVDIVLPSALTLWGDAGVSEYVQCIYAEENEPGVVHKTVYEQFPAGVSYNSGTRTVTVNITSGKTGRLHFLCSAWKPDGSTGESARWAVNVGPRVVPDSLNFTTGASVSYDVYAVCDCGILTTNGTTRAKTIDINGLAGSGLSYNDTTGLLTGTAVAGTYGLRITVTNSVGQTAFKVVPLVIAAAYAYRSWSGSSPGWFDLSDQTTITKSFLNVLSLANKRGGGDALAGSGVEAVPLGQNGLPVGRFVRDTANPARLSAPSALSTLSTMFQGNDQPYTVICVFRPTDTNTGFIWAASDTIDVTDSTNVALVRRSATASSVRRALVTATSNDVNFGAGNPPSTYVIAVVHSGTAVTVWDTSTTKSITAVAQNTAALSTDLIARLGAAETNGGTDPTLAPTACAMDMCEVIFESAARSDSDVQTAITDLMAKWGLTIPSVSDPGPDSAPALYIHHMQMQRSAG